MTQVRIARPPSRRASWRALPTSRRGAARPPACRAH